MNVQVTSRPDIQPAATSKLAIADGDIHPQRNSYKDLFPYMEARWVEMAKTFGSRPRQAYQAGPAYPKGQPNASRRDAWPPNGRPGSSLPFMQKQLLDENNITLGILNPTGDNGSSFQNREFGNGVASAMNRWVEAEWLIEPRLKGSIVVPYEDADAAVAEIERWAGDPRFVQVLMVSRTANPPGQKQYLEDLRGRCCGQSAGRRARLRLRRLSRDRRRLALVLHRGHGRPRTVVTGLPHQPRDRGCVRAHPQLQTGPDRVQASPGCRRSPGGSTSCGTA